MVSIRGNLILLSVAAILIIGIGVLIRVLLGRQPRLVQSVPGLSPPYMYNELQGSLRFTNDTLTD
jgi:hypothetical protein